MTINVMNTGIEWVTPFVPLNKGVQAISTGNYQAYLGSILFALLYSSFFLAASVMVFSKKGVQV